jgi:lysozyme
MTINAKSHKLLIKSWQEFLDSQGLNLNPDRIWGPRTTIATKKFQKEHKLEPDGKVGIQTISKAENLGFKLGFEVAGNLNLIFDISHHQVNVDLKKAKEFGMLGLFHKATQGRHYRDSMYTKHKKDALSNRLLWGAYHFGTNESGKKQADAFLNFSAPNEDTLLVLDLETNPKEKKHKFPTKAQSTMGITEAEAFVKEIKAQTGKYPGIYGGHYLKENAKTISNTILSSCWLWIAQYSTSPKLPKGWSDYVFWQYTDGKYGPSHEVIEGVGHCDRSMFKGDLTKLNDFWKTHSV